MNSENEKISAASHAQFEILFAEFLEAYPPTEGGRNHVERYEPSRREARENFEQIVKAAEHGEDITDKVLLKLLPYGDTSANRKKGAWTPLAPAIQGDLRKWYEAQGWTDPGDWPDVAQAIFDFVRRCNDRPEALEEACKEFDDLPYTTGFQTGMLTPILNALRPEEFLLINNKSRKTINYFAGTSHGQKLREYPETNATGWALIQELAPVMHQFDHPDLRESDLFDMFSHWLVAVKGLDQEKLKVVHTPSSVETDTDLAEPFSRIFEDREEAEWAFELLKETLHRLGVTDASDKRFSLTLRHNEQVLRLNFGNWAVLQFYGSGYSSNRMGIALIKDQVDIEGNIKRWRDFEQDEGEPGIRLYGLPIQTARPLEGPLREVYENTFAYIAERFKHWKASPYRKYNQPAIAEAVFDKSKRKTLLISGGSIAREPNIWWVNQGTSLTDEKQGGFLWAPYKSQAGHSIYHWDNLEEVQRGDIILHYANGSLRCVSQVQEPVVTAEKPHSSVDGDWEKKGRLIQTKYYDLTPPIPLSNFSDVLLDLDVHQGPIDSHGGVKQGYLFRFTLEALALILECSPEGITWPDFVTNLPVDIEVTNPVYTIAQCAEKTYFDESMLTRWVRAIERKKQAILYGPPGTGKTYLAEHLAKHLIGGGDGFSEVMQFHPAYAYEDFIQGLRPDPDADGGLRFNRVPGRFLDFCRRARTREGRCVLIIDEINRANLSRVFGELMYLLEYRDRDVPLAAGGRFDIPRNVRIIGTMNTADRSIALVDHALRRRFAFLALYPDYDILRRYHSSHQTGFDVEPLIQILKRLNREIDNRHYAVGITFFLLPELSRHIADIWQMEIEPYLEEYFFDQPAKVEKFRWSEIGEKVLQ
jgi:5-methylcytosine-specific restriction protein B